MLNLKIKLRTASGFYQIIVHRVTKTCPICNSRLFLFKDTGFFCNKVHDLEKIKESNI